MTPPHTQSPQKSPAKRNAFALLLGGDGVRPEPRPKAVLDRTPRSRIVKAVPPLFNQATLSARTKFQPIDTEAVIEQFQQHRRDAIAQLSPEEQASLARDLNAVWTHGETARRRISYTREAKLDAVNYAFTAKDPGGKPISRYMAAKNLNITLQMLKNWINTRHEIEASRKGTRKIRQGVDKESTMESKLTEEFVEARNYDRRINKRWFIHSAKAIYQRLYPERISRDDEGRIQYLCFKFSLGWFAEYRRRNGVAVRQPTKMSQKVSIFPDYLKDTLFHMMHANISMSLSGSRGFS